ncbi:MAG: hypothetical protein JW915_05580 [Chitinispirillaceae bacterium]|nr:hypothetical protein [Chitinispirillaceae bacterium]
MTNKLQEDLSSALSKLSTQFSADPELLHEAVKIVYSSILNKYGFSCVIVGGQSAAYWMRIPGSIDVDFVPTQRVELAKLFLHCGFTTVHGYKYRFLHRQTNVLIEIVDEKLDIE